MSNLLNNKTKTLKVTNADLLTIKLALIERLASCERSIAEINSQMTTLAWPEEEYAAKMSSCERIKAAIEHNIDKTNELNDRVDALYISK